MATAQAAATLEEPAPAESQPARRRWLPGLAVLGLVGVLAFAAGSAVTVVSGLLDTGPTRCDIHYKEVPVQLDGCALGSADLVNVSLRAANLRGAQLDGVNLRGKDLRGALLQGASLRGAHLDGAKLQGAHLEGADLGGASLVDTCLAGAHMERSNATGADAATADVRGATLTGATGWPTALKSDTACAK